MTPDEIRALVEARVTAEEKEFPPKPKDPMLALLDQMNGLHAAIFSIGKFSVLTEIKNRVTGYPDVHFSTVSDFKYLYQNRPKVSVPAAGEKGPKFVPLATWWLEHPHRREYRGIVFEPGREVEGYYNLWRGFGVQPKEGDWSRMADHIENNICVGDEEHFVWLIDWVADIFQNPGTLPGTAVVLRGEQGVGKGVFVNAIGALLGPHFVPIADSDRLTGRFNSHLKSSLLTFVDEGWWGGSRQGAGILKQLITEKLVTCEEKFQPAYQVQNFQRLIMASNSAWIVPGEFEMERRFFCLDVSNACKQDFSYFGQLLEQMQNGGYEAMLYDLLHRKITSNLREVPRTKMLFEQQLHSLRGPWRFWFHCLCEETIRFDPKEETIHCEYHDNSRWPKRVVTKDLFEAYRKFESEMRERYQDSCEIFVAELLKICPTMKKKRFRAGDARPCGYEIPELGLCRQFIEDRLGYSGTVLWPPKQSDEDATI